MTTAAEAHSESITPDDVGSDRTTLKYWSASAASSASKRTTMVLTVSPGANVSGSFVAPT